MKRLATTIRSFKSSGSRAVFGGLCLGALIFSATGCHQDMWNQPKYKPLAQASIFGDMQSARPNVPGAIPYKGAQLDNHFYKGLEGDKFASTIPMPITEALVQRGRERFDITCATCHGSVGDGVSLVASRGFEQKKPANFHEERLRNMPPGYFFDVITNGFATMYGFGPRIAVEDRWAIVAYIRALQLSQSASIDDLTEAEKQSLLNPQPTEQETSDGSAHGTH